jgi:predicted transcriptional regulator
MNNISIRDGLLAALTECYEADTAHFVNLPKQIVDSSSAREVIADLRNGGYVEERERGVIRFTRRGYESLRERFDSTGDESRVLLAV